MEESLGESQHRSKDEKRVWPFSSAKFQNPESSKKRKAKQRDPWLIKEVRKRVTDHKDSKAGEKFPIETDPLSLQNSRSLPHKIALPNTIARRCPSGEILEKSSWNSLQTKRERERRKTRGYVSRCPNFIHSHPFVRSFVRSFHSFCFCLFVCLGGKLFLCEGFCHSLGKKLVFSVSGVSQHTRTVCAFCFSTKIKSPRS
jgi:hypothetical protein